MWIMDHHSSWIVIHFGRRQFDRYAFAFMCTYMSFVMAEDSRTATVVCCLPAAIVKQNKYIVRYQKDMLLSSKK
jgi:hypothetical protein